MSEIVMYNKNLTGTEKLKVDTYLASKYGITLSGVRVIIWMGLVVLSGTKLQIHPIEVM